jgi:hypothetical protein
MDPPAQTSARTGARRIVRSVAIVGLLTGVFLIVPSVQGFGLAAGQDTRLGGSPAQLADELAGAEASRLVQRP